MELKTHMEMMRAKIKQALVRVLWSQVYHTTTALLLMSTILRPAHYFS